MAAAAGGGVFFAALAAGDVEEAPGVFVFFQEAFAGDDAAVTAACSVGVEAEAFAEASMGTMYQRSSGVILRLRSGQAQAAMKSVSSGV